MTLAIGHPAPDFTLKSQHGEEISLSSHRGRRDVLLVFFPFAFSGVCTGELSEIRDERESLDAEVLAISCDHFFANRAFADRDDYAFSILSDFWPHGEVARSYETFDEVIGAPRRGTFLIDRDGVLRWKIVNPVGEARDIDDYRTAISALS